MARLTERARRRRSTMVRLTLFVCLTGTLTAFIAAQIARVSFSGGYQIEATFDDASGLLEGDQVKVAGAPVGRVGGISVVNGRARVKLTVEDQVRLPADSEAAIRWRNALGQRVVYLIPGTSPQKLRDGARITRSRSVVDIGELINQLASVTRGIDSGQVNQLLTSFSQALDGNDDNATRLIANVDALSSTIAARRQTLDQMLKDYALVTGIIARRDKQIGTMTDNLVTLTGAFVDNRKLVNDALIQLSGMAGTTEKLLGRNADELGRTVDRLQSLTGGVRRNADTLTHLLTDWGPKLQRLFTVVDDGHFATGGAACIATGPPPCPYPMVLPAAQQGPGRIDSNKALKQLIVGAG